MTKDEYDGFLEEERQRQEDEAVLNEWYRTGECPYVKR